jgi:hypothetical protein
MPPGWQIAPDKRTSSDRPIAGEKPTLNEAARAADTMRVVNGAVCG